MNILESVLGANDGAAVNQIAAQLGLDPRQAASAMGALMPALAAGLQRNMQAPQGQADLLSALRSGRHDGYLDQPDSLGRPETVMDGNAILGHILGSKDVSRRVAANASQKTGIDPAILKKMLPLVAALAMGAMSKRTRQAAPADATGGIGGMLGGLLDRDGDGSPLDDLGGMLGGLFGKN